MFSQDGCISAEVGHRKIVDQIPFKVQGEELPADVHATGRQLDTDLGSAAFKEGAGIIRGHQANGNADDVASISSVEEQLNTEQGFFIWKKYVDDIRRDGNTSDKPRNDQLGDIKTGVVDDIDCHGELVAGCGGATLDGGVLDGARYSGACASWGRRRRKGLTPRGWIPDCDRLAAPIDQYAEIEGCVSCLQDLILGCCDEVCASVDGTTGNLAEEHV